MYESVQLPNHVSCLFVFMFIQCFFFPKEESFWRMSGSNVNTRDPRGQPHYTSSLRWELGGKREGERGRKGSGSVIKGSLLACTDCESLLLWLPHKCHWGCKREDGRKMRRRNIMAHIDPFWVGFIFNCFSTRKIHGHYGFLPATNKQNAYWSNTDKVTFDMHFFTNTSYSPLDFGLTMMLYFTLNWLCVW